MMSECQRLHVIAASMSFCNARMTCYVGWSQTLSEPLSEVPSCPASSRMFQQNMLRARHHEIQESYKNGSPLHAKGLTKPAAQTSVTAHEAWQHQVQYLSLLLP